MIRTRDVHAFVFGFAVNLRRSTFTKQMNMPEQTYSRDTRRYTEEKPDESTYRKCGWSIVKTEAEKYDRDSYQGDRWSYN